MTRHIPHHPVDSEVNALTATPIMATRGSRAMREWRGPFASRAMCAIAFPALIAGALLVAAASDVCAPEPARLNGSLSTKGSLASATYTTSKLNTYGYQWPGSWAVGSAPSGTPCATYAASAGTTLLSVIYASGSYRKCV